MKIRLRSAVDDSTLTRLAEELILCADKQTDLHTLAQHYSLMYIVPDLLEGLETVQALQKAQELFVGYSKLSAFTDRTPILVPVEQAYAIALFLAAVQEYMNEYQQSLLAM